MKTKVLAVAEIVFDKDVYPRANPDWTTVARYYHAMKSGSEFPPITVAKLDGKYLIIDGYHRLTVRKQLKQTHINVEVIEVKDKRDAYIEAVKRNVSHGRPFNTQDIAQVAINLKDWKLTKEQISSIIHIPVDKIESFVASRAVKVVYGKPGEEVKERDVALTGTLQHLAGSTQDESFVRGQDKASSNSSSQVGLIEALINILENGWLDLTDEDVRDSINHLRDAINDVLPPVVPKVKSDKKQKAKK